MQRTTLLIIPALIAIALYIGITNIDSIGSPPETETQLQPLDYNAYSEGINTILYNLDGQINYTLQASSQTHYKDDATEFEKPFIKLYENGDSRWNIVANSGRISALEDAGSSTDQIIELQGNVEVHSLDELGNRMVMTTEFLTLDPQLEILETDEPVTFVTDTVQQSSIGMTANLRLDEFTFLRDIRGSYEQATN